MDSGAFDNVQCFEPEAVILQQLSDAQLLQVGGGIGDTQL